MTKRSSLLGMLILEALLCACGGAQRKGEAPPAAISEARSNEMAQRVWQGHQEVIERAARGEAIYGDTFERSCQFLHEVSGISVPGTGNYVGWAPTKDTGKALQPLHAWYAANKDRLYWDEATKTVKVRPPAR